ncbi:MAG TPA: hypothetical protein VFP56_08175, partial [Candidatus Limnocylindrales bacterium]|nr:hypothetical protein [Candidatus Limnocylindrales bacterium]
SGLPFSRVIDALMLADPERHRTLGEMRGFCEDFSLRMQQGGDEYVHATQWLDQYWTVDEYLLIKLCLEARLDDLYAEAFEVLAALLPAGTEAIDPRLALADALRLNRARLRLPGVDGSVLVRSEHDIDAFYEDVLAGREPELHRRRLTYEVEHGRSAAVESWLRDLVRDRAESKFAAVTAAREGWD